MLTELRILMVLAALLLATSSFAGQLRTIWHIGDFDKSGAGFALWPAGAHQLPDYAPDGRFVYTVGESQPSDWPFLHPAKADISWAKHEVYHYIVRFNREGAAQGQLMLRVAFQDTHEGMASVFHARLNQGAEVTQKLALGDGRVYYGENRGRPSELLIPLEASTLRQGQNELDLWLTDGSWCAYDALALVELPAFQTLPERPEPVTSGLTANLLPLHADGSIEALQAEGLSWNLAAGWLRLTSLEPAASARIRPVLDDGLMRLEFDLVLGEGTLGLEAKAPNGYGPAWTLRLGEGQVQLGRDKAPLPEGKVLHVLIDQTLTEVRASVASEGRGVELSTSKPRGAALQLAFRAEEAFTLAALTNLAWTEPVLLGPVEAGSKTLKLTVKHPIGPAQVTVSELDASGNQLAETELQWPLGELELRAPLTGKAAKLQVELRSEQVALTTELVVQQQAEVLTGLPKTGAFLLESPEGQWIGNEAFAARLGKGGVDLLLDRRTSKVLANKPYRYHFGEGELAISSIQPATNESGATLTISGAQGGVQFRHTLHFPKGEGYFEERLVTSNGGEEPANLSGLRCGFARQAVSGGLPVPELATTRFIAVPLRHDPLEPLGSDEDFDLLQVLSEQGAYRDIPHDHGERARTTNKGSEGWLLQDETGGALVLTYSNEHLAWSLIGPGDSSRTELMLGGFGTWHGDPEEAGWLASGASYDWGLTRWYSYEGDLRQGYYAFRRFMTEQGHGIPEGFNPPVHWNEIYDNKLWWGPDSPENRAKYYRLEDILWEAQKAHEAHCEALYLDPGWDTSFGTHIWDAARLGTVDEFCHRMREEYELEVSLHTPLADWASGGGAGTTYPSEAWRVDEAGEVVTNALCSGARAYIDEQSRRLIELCRGGVTYLMFDGSAPTGPCFAKDHGHPVPYTRDDHARAIAEIARNVHAAYPDVIIEEHDQVVAGRPIAYCPQYYMHDAQSWTERWGYEFMWGPLYDITSGRAISLYYYNLAYGLPMYLHIDLRPQDEHCLALWWFASTCRHLGIGGTHADGRSWEQIKRSMALYQELAAFFKRGEFYGLAEDTHAHTLPDEGTVLTVFNLTNQPVERTLAFTAAEVGLESFAGLVLSGCEGEAKGKVASLQLSLPAYGVAVIKLLRN